MEAAFRTERAVKAWLAALPAVTYDVRLVPADGDGPALRRRVSGGGLLRLLPWLRSMNARDHHIYARPASPTYLLIDDLDEDSLDALHAAGHRPAAIVVTSPNNHQAWLRLPGEEGSISPDMSSAVARLAARRFDGDVGAASSVQVGRLPGLTSRKNIYADRYGRHPYVLLRAAWGGVDPAGAILLQAAAKELATGCFRKLSPSQPFAGASPRYPRQLRPCAPEEEWKEGRRRVLESHPGEVLDRSRLDHAIASRLFGRRAGEDYVRAVLLSGERARGMGRSVQDYIERTLVSAARVTGG
jgi:hypothetical protein